MHDGGVMGMRFNKCTGCGKTHLQPFVSGLCKECGHRNKRAQFSEMVKDPILGEIDAELNNYYQALRGRD